MGRYLTLSYIARARSRMRGSTGNRRSGSVSFIDVSLMAKSATCGSSRIRLSPGGDLFAFFLQSVSVRKIGASSRSAIPPSRPRAAFSLRSNKAKTANGAPWLCSLLTEQALEKMLPIGTRMKINSRNAELCFSSNWIIIHREKYN